MKLPQSVTLQRFDLRRDQEEPAVIDAQIRQGVNAVGANLWVLIFAIMIASVGLNVNSTAVIIGAMLISPLMGPIVGIGYGAGVNDFELIHRAARNLGLMTAISLITATLYFSVSPLAEAQSELLARTTPTLWDVLIAFFGGSAGIVAATRRSVPNVVPGVAIATALMPPLCTTGFGIASGNWEYAGGAFFLFAINGVFIALATLLFVKITGLPQKVEVDQATATRQRWVISAIVALMIGPSAFLAYRLVVAERFENIARGVLREYADDSRFYLLGSTLDARGNTVRLAITGDSEPSDIEAEVARKLALNGLSGVSVEVRQAGRASPDMKPIEEFLRNQQVSSVERQLDDARKRLLELEGDNANLRRRQQLESELLAEVQQQFPEAQQLSVTTGEIREVADATAGAKVVVVRVVAALDLADDTAQRLQLGWKSRFPDYRIEFEVIPPAPEATDAEGEAAADEEAVPEAGR